jgi:hypothetical protein
MCLPSTSTTWPNVPLTALRRHHRKQWRFNLKLDSPPALVVTSAWLPEYEQLERFRKHALNAAGFTRWVYSEPRNRLDAGQGT